MTEKLKDLKNNIWTLIGLVGVVACVGLFLAGPSFPTPDKLIVFLFFIFLVFHQAKAMLAKLLPFVVVILAYESFRGIAHLLNQHVNYNLAPAADRLLFV